MVIRLRPCMISSTPSPSSRPLRSPCARYVLQISNPLIYIFVFRQTSSSPFFLLSFQKLQAAVAGEGEGSDAEREGEEQEEDLAMSRQDYAAPPDPENLDNAPFDYADYLDDHEIAALEAGEGVVGDE